MEGGLPSSCGVFECTETDLGGVLPPPGPCSSSEESGANIDAWTINLRSCAEETGDSLASRQAGDQRSDLNVQAG